MRVQNHLELESKFKANLNIIEKLYFKFKKEKKG